MTQQKREGRGRKLRFDQKGWPGRQDGVCVCGWGGGGGVS
jgi:hypothetical protein